MASITTLSVSPSAVPIDGTSKFTIAISYATGANRLKSTTVTVAGQTYSLGTITGSSFTWTPPLSLLNSITTSRTQSVQFSGTPANALIDMSGAVYGYSAVTVPDIYAPDAPANVKMTRINNGVPDAWGVYVQGVSQAILSWTASQGKGGATIRWYRIKLDAEESSARLEFGDATSATLSLSLAGARTLTISVEDSRNYISPEVEIPYTVEPYSRPEITAHSVERCNAEGSTDNLGTYIKVKVSYTFASIGGRNTADATVAYKRVADSTYSAEIALQQSTELIFGGSLSATTAYHIRFTVTDAVGTVTTYIATAEPLKLAIGLLANAEGAAFGKEATHYGALETAWPIMFSNGFRILPGYAIPPGGTASSGLFITNSGGTPVMAILDTGILLTRGAVYQNQNF